MEPNASLWNSEAYQGGSLKAKLRTTMIQSSTKSSTRRRREHSEGSALSRSGNVSLPRFSGSGSQFNRTHDIFGAATGSVLGHSSSLPVLGIQPPINKPLGPHVRGSVAGSGHPFLNGTWGFAPYHAPAGSAWLRP
mmetsp:Transcript_97372/g.160279  ORF Transcript_97372/g.160279 Transcript_97372/m.160279 type:complete len:136 (-) Transcript_97372:98-505(-)